MACVSTINRISEDCVKLTLSTGSCFFVRLSYITSELQDNLFAGRELDDEEMAQAVEAGSAYAAERAASVYLERCEQSRFLLTGKLLRKGYEKTAVQTALDYLEQKGWLSDERFAEAWLRNRAIHHAEGPERLRMELIARGINAKTAADAVDTFFKKTELSSVFQKAVKKCRKQGKNPESTILTLRKKGFSINYIKSNISKI